MIVQSEKPMTADSFVAQLAGLGAKAASGWTLKVDLGNIAGWVVPAGASPEEMAAFAVTALAALDGEPDEGWRAELGRSPSTVSGDSYF
jgi:hypothetical protein